MNAEPIFPKPKKFCPDSIKYQPFPVFEVKEDQKKFQGYFTGLCVEVFGYEDIKAIHRNGCYGIGSRTKVKPRALSSLPKEKFISKSVFERRQEWNRLLGNCGLPETTVNMLLEDEYEHLLQLSQEKDDTFTRTTERPETKFITQLDPFPLEESLVLFPEEAFFLHYSLKCLTIYDFRQPNDPMSTDTFLDRCCKLNPNFISHYVAYHYLRSKNWVVKRGFKFGGDFLLYHKGPQFYHASYVVIITDYNTNITNIEMQSIYRVAETVNKNVLILEVTYPNTVKPQNAQDCIENLSLFKVNEVCPARFHLNSSTKIREYTEPPATWQELKSRSSSI